MIIHRNVAAALLGTALLLTHHGLATQALAAAATESIDRFKGAEAPTFATPEEAVAAFKTAIAADDVGSLAKLLGLDAGRLKTVDGLADRLAEIRAAAAKLVNVETDGDLRIINLGTEAWPFPFPVVKGRDGKWAFDTTAGIEEIVNRRVGENELQAIDTVRRYVEAQRDYASEDRDDDGVLEYAQQLLSTPGKTDGLYWPVEQGDGDSPFGAGIDQAMLDKAKAGDGYFGYRFRILRGQGSNIAGGRYDYVINGNMIAGFALIAWPAKYGVSGVKTFVVNQAGVVYQRDLGAKTEALASDIRRFNPDTSWEIVKD